MPTRCYGSERRLSELDRFSLAAMGVNSILLLPALVSPLNELAQLPAKARYE